MSERNSQILVEPKLSVLPNKLALTTNTQNHVFIQYSVHSVGRIMAREIASVFCNVDFQKGSSSDKLRRDFLIDNLLVIPTFQRSFYDLVGITDETNRERDALLENIYEVAHKFRSLLQEQNPEYWADLTDPASGYPLFSPRGLSLYPDVDGAQRLLKYQTELAGCCRIILHPKWGTRNYPATMFTTAPLNVVEDILGKMFSNC
ncbi:hypothetical protein HK096_011372 [Nowakowskiella sp. JEL0078]|nr:hypothetical protein HK096_011372 [Nowakowskiella sp. JEL0078]